MPGKGITKVAPAEILSFEELRQVAAIAVSLGVVKIRITGGEPTVRKGLVPFLAELAEIPGLDELVLTSNGILLAEQAADLRIAGVRRLNISLDSLNPATFSTITRGGDLRRFLPGEEILQRVAARHPLVSSSPPPGPGPARLYRFAGGRCGIGSSPPSPAISADRATGSGSRPAGLPGVASSATMPWT
jgi:cyclic pyranopterin phosphate synthase